MNLLLTQFLLSLFIVFASTAYGQRPSQPKPSSNRTDSCIKYPGGICSSYVTYPVFAPYGVSDIENQIRGPLSQLTTELGELNALCVDTYYRYACTYAYPKCDMNDTKHERTWTTCKSTCEEVLAACGDTFALTGLSPLLPDCSKSSPSTPSTPPQPDDNCNMIPPHVTLAEGENPLNLSAIPFGFMLATCPAPFVRDPLAKPGTNDTLQPRSCRYGCCIPCPAQNYFYRVGWAETGFLVTNIIRCISAVLSLFIVISYLVLPDKRRHPSLLILNLSIGVFLFNLTVFFSIGDPVGLQCASDVINESTQDNNALCAAQGAVLIFAAFATCLWCAALIINLHVYTVWNRNYFTERYLYLNAVCWGIPAAMTAVALGLHSIKFEFANLCLVKLDYISEILFYPMAAIICPSFIIHIATFFYIAKVAFREGVRSEMSQTLSAASHNTEQHAINVKRRHHKHVIAAVKIQWRALLLAVVACGTVLFYWLFYLLQVPKITNLDRNLEITSDWIACILMPGGSQNSCVSIISPYLPPYGLMITAELLVSLIGIWLFLMFAKRSLWHEWNNLIYDIRIMLGARGRVEKNGEQFFQL
ncbi:uncharacterized protein BYT42DRAFT_614261 [Radiomyces spectabilis]|uniref:uncharacterized protein n=1 Tax=Radiomyces spectabilis TaxID=64574 RepID=UPI00221F0EC9|nr:uncharacterized protein BYT42DRAFT_614261 [Radiomyces spectabilis]KAI8377588.1 hypothetical protein BYT42DRAFT_614261 [Radiomyces spectabilis]